MPSSLAPVRPPQGRPPAALPPPAQHALLEGHSVSFPCGPDSRGPPAPCPTPPPARPHPRERHCPGRHARPASCPSPLGSNALVHFQHQKATFDSETLRRQQGPKWPSVRRQRGRRPTCPGDAGCDAGLKPNGNARPCVRTLVTQRRPRGLGRTEVPHCGRGKCSEKAVLREQMYTLNPYKKTRTFSPQI